MRSGKEIVGKTNMTNIKNAQAYFGNSRNGEKMIQRGKSYSGSKL